MWPGFFRNLLKQNMAEIQKKDRQPGKTERPAKPRHQSSQESAAGVPGAGGSRQGNIGHESNERSDNAHR